MLINSVILQNLLDYKYEQVNSAGGRINFYKFGKIGIIAFDNVTSTDTIFNYPSWFITEGIHYYSALTADIGISSNTTGEFRGLSETSCRIWTSVQTRESLSGSASVVLK